MSDYTPTTGQVADGFTHAPEHESEAEARAMFDRWLASVKAEAWDEGFAEGLGDRCSCDSCLKWVSNPYREETE